MSGIEEKDIRPSSAKRASLVKLNFDLPPARSSTSNGTPIDLNRLVKIRKPTVRVRYELQEIGKPDLMDVLKPFLKRRTR